MDQWICILQLIENQLIRRYEQNILSYLHPRGTISAVMNLYVLRRSHNFLFKSRFQQGCKSQQADLWRMINPRPYQQMRPLGFPSVVPRHRGQKCQKTKENLIVASENKVLKTNATKNVESEQTCHHSSSPVKVLRPLELRQLRSIPPKSC